MWLYRFVSFYKKQRQKLFDLIGKENGELLLKAIRHDSTIMIYEKGSNPQIDGDLYRILKSLGAKSIKNATIVLENEGFIQGAYVAYFNETISC